MNHLVPTAENAWRLPRHAHVVVYERERAADGDDGKGDASDTDNADTDERGLLTIYDCGAAQQPPSAQLLGTLESVGAEALVEPQPTGRIVKLREPATLERDDSDRFRIRRS